MLSASAFALHRGIVPPSRISSGLGFVGLFRSFSISRFSVGGKFGFYNLPLVSLLRHQLCQWHAYFVFASAANR
jgi:hypothetical protein